ncbi:MAG: AEC family transporter [Tissierellaceae bacterium]|nr:AEC family transporter [Tissierellaceae bacterium]
MEMSAILNSVISLFIMILVGVYGGKRNIINSKLNKGLTDILIQISLPFMIVSSFIFTYDDSIKSNIIKTFYYSLIAYILIIIISYILVIPVKNDKKTVLHFANVFTNTGYVGFPILNSIYGPEGVIYGSIFNMFFVLLVWTYGIMLYEGKLNTKAIKSEIKKILLNPSIIAVAIGILIFTYKIQLPHAILFSINSIGNMTGPLSMIIIGVILSKVKFRDHLNDWSIYYGIFTNLIAIPFIVYLIFYILFDSSIAILTVIIMTAMPASTMTSILAESYNKEKEYAAILVSLTTLLSLITVPILMKFMM